VAALLTSAAVSNVTKRQRQKERKAERLRLEAQIAKRKRLTRGVIIFGLILLPVVIAFVVIRVVNNNDKKATTCAPTANVPAGSPPLQVDPKAKYSANIETTEGSMVVSLDTCTQLWGANNFITLARKGFYDGTSFHRAAKDFVIESGDPKGDGSGGPGYSFVSELPAKGYKVGDLAYAKTGTDPAGTAGSQFFIITSDKALTTFNAKPYQYGQFASLTSGLDVAQKIQGFAPESGDGKPTTDVKINRITVIGPVVEPATTTAASASTEPTTTTAAK
jgi:cyclophilin family peptidyl-prolyl cis-trans isomerase